MTQKAKILLPRSNKPLHHVLEDVFSGVKNRSVQAKLVVVKQEIEKLYQKFNNIPDLAVFKELDRVAAILEDEFILHRSTKHLAKLVFFITQIRKRLSQEITFLSLKNHYDIRLIPVSLRFTFGSKSVLGVLAHGYLKDKYQTFDEEHILLVIRKSIAEAQLIKDSIYAFQTSKSGIKTLYFEIDKKSGLPFSSEEIKQLKGLLKQEIKFCVEQLVPHIFMTRNEEEVLRNILTLNREIRRAKDLPQVMIFFDQQTSQEALFTIILVRICHKKMPSITECFSRIQGHFVYSSDRCQIVRYLANALPVEANVFRIALSKDASLLRADLSLNFYLARQKIGDLLTEAIGEFRDFNGGIILKQREGLICLMETFPKLSLGNPDLLESFFYSLSPIEAQAILPSATLRYFFGLFSQAIEARVTKPSDYCLKCAYHNDQLFLMIRLPDESFKETVNELLTHLQLTRTQVITSVMTLENSWFLGYLLQNVDQHKQHKLHEELIEALKEWKAKIERRQILKLCIGANIVSLDPRAGGDQISAVILKMLFEGLMRMNRQGVLEFGIAKHLEISSDQRTYLFQLRPSRWSDGSQVTAYDFEYAWKKVLSPTFKTPFAYLFYPIKNAKLAREGALSSDAIGITVLNDLTLKIELEFPAPYFLELAAHPIYSPVHRLIDQYHPNWPFEDKNRYVCNGAFYVNRKNSNENYGLMKNPLYWDSANIKLDEIVILKTDSHRSYEMFQNNLNHWVGAPLGTCDPSFIPSKEEELIVFSDTNVYWIVFNTQIFPFHHKKIRQALSWGINHLALKNYIPNPLATSPLPPVHSQIKQSICYSLKQAQKLFKEALEELNLSVSDFPIISLMYLVGSPRAEAVNFLKEEWQATFGIRSILEPLEWSILFTKMTEGNFQIGGLTWEPWVNDPIYTLNAFRGNNELINFSKWEHQEYQKVIAFAEREANLEKRQSYYLQAEKILLEEIPVLPLFLVEPPAIKKNNFHVYCSPMMDFKWGYFSEKV